MEKEHDVVIAARLLAFQSLLQNIFRSWGVSQEELLTQLRRSKEALHVSHINQGLSEPFAAQVNAEFDIAIRSLECAIRDLPDTRPDPIG